MLDETYPLGRHWLCQCCLATFFEGSHWRSQWRSHNLPREWQER